MKRWSITLNGLEPASPTFEGNDQPSTVVIHGAPYASADFLKQHGYLGRSNGCPAMSFSDVERWKDRLSNGTLFYFFH